MRKTAPSQTRQTGQARTPRRRVGASVSVVDALNANEAFPQLLAGVHQLRALEGELTALLPDYLRASVAPSTLRDGALVILANHNALAARLRHLEPGIVAGLQRKGWAIESLKVRVRPLPAPVATPAKEARLSPYALACLDELRQGLDASTLKDALGRMVERHYAAARTSANTPAPAHPALSEPASPAATAPPAKPSAEGEPGPRGRGFDALARARLALQRKGS